MAPYGHIDIATKTLHEPVGLDVGKHFQKITVPIFRLVRQNFSLPGGRLNKKDGLTRYGDSHVKDKTS